MDPLQTDELLSGFHHLDEIVMRIRRRRYMCVALWCVGAVCMVYDTVWYAWNNAETDALSSYLAIAAVAMFAVFTVSLLVWARYPRFTTEEMARVQALHNQLTDVQRVSAQDLCDAYGYSEMLLRPDRLEERDQDDPDVLPYTVWSMEKVDYFEFPANAKSVRFPVAFRRYPIPKHYRKHNPHLDHGTRCVVEIRDGRARVLADGAWHALDSRGAALGLCTAVDPANGVGDAGKGETVTSVYWQSDTAALHRVGERKRIRSLVDADDGFLWGALMSLVLPGACIISMYLGFKEAKRCFREIDRRFRKWFGVWSIFLTVYWVYLFMGPVGRSALRGIWTFPMSVDSALRAAPVIFMAVVGLVLYLFAIRGSFRERHPHS